MTKKKTIETTASIEDGFNGIIAILNEHKSDIFYEDGCDEVFKQVKDVFGVELVSEGDFTDDGSSSKRDGGTYSVVVKDKNSDLRFAIDGYYSSWNGSEISGDGFYQAKLVNSSTSNYSESRTNETIIFDEQKETFDKVLAIMNEHKSDLYCEEYSKAETLLKDELQLTLKFVGDFTDDGGDKRDGSGYEVVYTIPELNNVKIGISCYYSSWNGSDFNGDFREVFENKIGLTSVAEVK